MLYAITIFLGAFLLFQIEPVVGKFILPWFGGGPGVWSTCLVFFQSALVVGYGYAHLIGRRLPLRKQAVLHSALLAVALFFLPIAPGSRWKPDPAGNPALQILTLLTANLGLPYVLLAATGPLVQEWLRRAQPGRSPYRLYALSNAGSLLALLTYPFYFEFAFTRHAQAIFWGWAMAGFAGCCACCAWQVASKGQGRGCAPGTESEDHDASLRSNRPGLVRLGQGHRLVWAGWIGLPALASALLVGTTNKLCLDLAAAPFLWVLPLALYLLSFVLSFDHPRWYRPALWSALAIAAAAGIGKLLFIDDSAPLYVQLAVYSTALLAGCMVCHGEVYRLRPAPARLTGYYLAISVGGACGGIAAALVAPAVLHSFAEVPIGYGLLSAVIAALCLIQESAGLALGALVGAVLALLVIPLAGAPAVYGWRGFAHEAQAQLALFSRQFLGEIAVLLGAALGCFGHWRRGWTRGWTLRASAFAAAVSAALGSAYLLQANHARESVVGASRNFFGLLTVIEEEAADPALHHYLLMHGKITHGLQFTDPVKARWPTTYYGEDSGVGRAIATLPADRPRHLGLIGLGTGTLATYLRREDTMRIYEINPQVPPLARTRFRYVPGSAGRVDLVMGDARLSIEREIAAGHPPRYDVLAVDAFSSDAIPVHLLTREAFALYRQELAPDGILAVHISNRFFDLEPVVTGISHSLGLACVLVDDSGDDERMTYATSWMLVARDPSVLHRPGLAEVSSPGVEDGTQRLWTDDYSSLFSVLR